MDFKQILVKKENQIVRVTLNNPKAGNALNLELRLELIEFFQRISEDESARVVVVSGAGKNFCAGGDIRTMEGVTPVAGRLRLKTGQRLVKAMIGLEKPIIGAIHGAVAGAGASVALACDILIASEKTRILMPYVNIGLIPDWGLFYFLPLRVGMTRAKELMLTGDPIDAQEADRIGLINRVVSPEKLEEEAMAMAARLASGPSQAQAMIKSALNRWPADLETLLEMESTMQAVAFSSQDFDEGRRAFLEKRKPEFRGE
ncbi:MAG: enoyl-CoA hydratase/isomerase family protein [Deltaproteobacteria bacterium]|nr:enoyl-CoA hydratase/isomerase family protein [Deltaproteobacteria bacterium]MBW2051489.1 enoyl-CoA hydratase/isomerase family protein [Deltaproteobacteria bacterium]MBW2142134.1 enoyl-CoA hydratase/isomerase family protein [Deltaproteobacteria bacterium]MBW2323734.1 enoyl-CoA hydratase/isomerase family protein [Deltaproteobacteria bacterium]